MAAFNLTAQLNLKGPSNIGSIVSSIKNQLGNINTTVKFTLDPNAAKNVSQLDASLKSLNQTFKDTQQSATAAATAISKFTSAMSQGNSVSQYSNQLNQANQAAKNLASTQASTSKAIEESSSSMQEFGKQAGLAVRRFAAFSSVTSVIYGLVSAIGKGTSEFISFDKEFVKLQQVTGESAEGLKSLGRVITSLSAGLGTSSSELVDIASTLAQAGLSARDTEKALKALALSSLAPSFDSMNETVEGSIALMRQFDISAGDLEKALGAVNSVAAKFAVEASDIITAIQRTGGVFATASKGVSEGTDALNEFIAVFTSVRATTRESAETIATGLRTIFTRIQRESTIDALKEYGVNLQNLDGKFVGAYKSVELLSQGLSRLDPRDVKFSKIIEELGGFRQIGKVIPLIQEFATAQQALSVAQQGQGSLATDAAKAQLSLANQIAKTREEFLALFRDIGSSNTFQTMVTGALQLTSALIKVVGAAKGLLPMFTAIAAVQGAKAISRFAGGLYEGLSGGGKDSSKKGFATGGLVPGVGDSDSVPAMLTPGEFVVRKAAVKAMGVNKLHSMNKYATGGKIETFTVEQLTKAGGPETIFEFAKKKKDIELDDKVTGKINKIEPNLGPKDFKEIISRSEAIANESAGGKSSYRDLELTQENKQNYLDVYFGKGSNKRKWNPQASLWKSAEKRWGSAFEDYIVAHSDDQLESVAGGNFPIDVRRKRGKAPAEVKFRSVEEEPETLISKLFRYKIKSSEQKLLSQFTEARKDKIDDIQVGNIDYYRAGESKHKFYEYLFDHPDAYQKFADGGWVKRMQQQPINKLKDELGLLDSTLELFGFQRKVPISTFSKSAPFMEDAGKKEVKERIDAIQKFLAAKEPQKEKEVEKEITLPKAPSNISDHLKSLIAENKTYEITRGVYGGVVKQALNEAYRGNLGPGNKQENIDKVGPKSIVRYNPDREYVDVPLGVLENDVKYIDKVKSLEGRDVENLTANKGYSVSDMLDTIRAYQAIGLDGALNPALGRKEDLSQSLADVAGLNKTKRKKLGPAVDQPLSYFAGSLDAAMQFSLPEKLYSGIGASKQKLFIESAGVKINKLEDTKKLVGKTVSIPSFLSTSEVPATAESFARTGMMTIETNKKSKGLSPERAKTDTINRDKSKIRKMDQRLISDSYGKGKADESFADDYDIESEYILPRNSQFKVKNIEANNNSTEGGNLLESLNMDWAVKMLNRGGKVQKFADGGVAQRKVGYIDYDVIANPDNEAVVKKGMEVTGMTGPRLYTDYLTQLAVQARKDSSLDKLRAVYGVAGSGKTTLARGQGTDSGTLRQTERFPILSPEDIQRATEVLVLSSSVSKDKLDSFFGDTDRTYTLSSTTKEEREGVRSRRAGRDISGIGLENRKPGSTTNVATDTAVSEALLSDRLGSRSVVLGRSESGRLRRKQGDELVDIVKKKIGFSWGGFAPMTAGHESIMDAAAAMGIPPEDFIYLVGSNEGIKPGDASSYRTAVFDQDFRMILAKAGAGSRGATVLPKPRDFEVPQAFDISQEGSGRRTVLLPKKGSRTFVADKGPEQTKKYKEAGYAVSNIERSGGISGTMVRDLIMAGDMGKLQEVLSPNVYEIISNNVGRLQNRANALPEIIEQVKKSQGVDLAGVEKEIKAVGITRVDNKKAAADPEYAAKVQALQDLRDKRDKIKSSASFEPYRILAEMARKNPEKYGLDLSTMSSEVPSMRTMSSGNIQKFVDGGWVQRMQSQKKSTLKEDLKFLQSAMVFSDETGSYVPTYAKENEKEVVDAKEMLERYNAMSQFITGPRSAKSALKPTAGYNPQELLDAVTYYQAGSGPLTRAMVNNDFIFTDRNEAYDTEDLVGRLSAASQYKLPKKLYSGFGRGQFNEILKDTNTTVDDLIGKKDQAIESLVGKTVDFPTFLSTSVNPTVAEGFVGDPGALFSIDSSKSKSMGIDILKAKSTASTSAPPESRRLPGLDKIKQHKLAGYDQEKEFILQPNSQFKILKASGSISEDLKDKLAGIKKKKEQKSFVAKSDAGEEFTVYEPDFEAGISEILNEKSRINIQAQMLSSGGRAQRFAEGGRALSPLLQSIYDSLADKPEWLREFGLPDSVTTDVPAKTIAQLYSGKNFPTDPSFGMFAGKPISIDNVNSVWRKSFSPSMSQEKIANYTAAKNYLAKTLKDDTTEQAKLTIRDVNKSTKLGIVGLQPTDKKEVQGPMKLGDKDVTLFIAGLSSEYDTAVKNMRRGVEGVVGQFGADIQDTKIFGSSEKYAFDFDETLVTGADILDANGKPDIPRYGDIDAVRESMKGAKLTQLGEKVKRLMALDPSFIKKSRILTARPQMTAGILSDTLQGLGLPFQESDITGVSTPVKDGGLNIVDEKTKRINNSIIAKAKAQDVRELEALIDDNLQNVTETKKTGKKAFHYTELKDLTPEEKAASGFPNIEGAITQSVMTVLGATGGLIQNGAVDYENGLGPAAQYFPGIGSDWPTEVKRTLDSNAISDAKKEFTRYYKEDGNKGILAQAFADGGLAEPKQKKEKQYGKIGLTEDSGMINAGYFQNDTRSGYATAYKMRDYLYYVGLSSATNGYGPKLYDVLMEAATEKGAMLTSDRSLVSGDAKNVWEYYFNNRSDVKKTPLKPSDWTLNSSLIDPKLYGKEETWPPANDPAWILQSGYSKSPSIINSPDVVRSSAKVDYRALMSSFFSEKRGSSEPTVASNSNGEEFTVGYSKMATGGKVDKSLDQYKQILGSILPPEMLTKDGMLKMPSGQGESIHIIPPAKKTMMQSLGLASYDEGKAYYSGGLDYKALRHLLNQRRSELAPDELETLDRFISQNLAFVGNEDEISLRGAKHKGVLAHETFHDIQGFLYDNHPEIMDKIISSVGSQKDNIEAWYKDPANKKFTGKGNYEFKHLFPESPEDSPYGPHLQNQAREALVKRKRSREIKPFDATDSFYGLLDDTQKQLGANETIPILLGAASEGNKQAAGILSKVFENAGLKPDFMDTLPKFAAGGMVPGVGNGDTVPAMLNVGDFVIRKSSVNSIGPDKLASMAGYAAGGSVSDKVPALLTPGEFVFSKTAAQKIGYPKLHSMNKVGKFASGGAVGLRMGYADGGAIQDLGKFLSNLSSILNSIPTRAMSIRPDTIDSSTTKIDNTTTTILAELAKTIQDVGIKASQTAALVKQGENVSYKATIDAMEADLERAKIVGLSSKQIIAIEDVIKSTREKSAKVVRNKEFLEKSFSDSDIGKKGGSGAAQQAILTRASELEPGIRAKQEKAYRLSLIGSGLTYKEIVQKAKERVESPEAREQAKDISVKRAVKQVTGVTQGELSSLGINPSDIQQYIAQSKLDRKTLEQMDKRLIAEKEKEVEQSQAYNQAILPVRKQMIENARNQVKKEITQRREVLDPMAKEQGLPGLKDGGIIESIAGIAGSGPGIAGLAALSSLPGLIEAFGPATKTSGGAAFMGGFKGAAETATAGVTLAGQLPFAAGPILAATAIASLASAAIKARNAFIEFEKEAAGKQLETSLNNLQQLFADLAKDTKDLRIQNQISTEIQKGVGNVSRIQEIESSFPKAFFANSLDALFASRDSRDKGTANGTQASSDRSKILEKFGTGAYYRSTGFGQATLGLTAIGADARADKKRKMYLEMMAPEEAQERAKRSSALSESSQALILNKAKSGMTATEISKQPDYEGLARSIALANNSVQEQILAIERSNLVNKEAAKTSIIRQYAEEQLIKITRQAQQERAMELSERAGRQFSMSFDRMFANMNQAIMSTNNSLDIFNDRLDSSVGALSGQASIGKTNLGDIGTLKTPNISSSDSFSSAASRASSLFGTENKLVESILVLGRDLESSLMSTINNTIQKNPKASDTKISSDIENSISSLLSKSSLPPDLTAQLSKSISIGISEIRRKEGEGTKDRKIDFAELLRAIPGLKDTVDALKTTNNSVISSLENYQAVLDRFTQKLEASSEKLKEAAERRFKADDIVIDSSIQLAKTFGSDINPALGNVLRNQRTSRMTGGVTDPNDLLLQINQLQSRSTNQRDNLSELKNRTVGQSGATQTIIDNEKALSRTNYQLNQTYSALKNLADSSDAASNALSAIQAAQQKQAGKVSLIEKLVTSAPEELDSFNRALVRLQRTAGGESIYQTADQRKEILSVLNDITPLMGSSQEANNFKANTLENLLKTSGIGLNPQFQSIINSIRNPEADPAVKQATEEYKNAVQVQSEANKAIAELNTNISTKLVEDMSRALKDAITNTRVKFDDQSIKDIVNGIRSATTVVAPGAPVARASGGIIYSAAGSYVDFQPKGTDTVPAMLTPGEFVMSKPAVDRIGSGTLSRMNKGYSNGGQVSYYADGGYVSSILQNKYVDRSSGDPKIRKTGTYSVDSGTQNYPNLSEEFTLANLNTVKNLQILPNFTGASKGQISSKKNERHTITYSSPPFLGYGVPYSAIYYPTIVSHKGAYKYGSAGGTPKVTPIGEFLDPRSTTTASILDQKPLIFDGPESEATKEFQQYKEKLAKLNTYLPKKIQEKDKGYSIIGSAGSFNISSVDNVLSRTKEYPSVSTGRGPGVFSIEGMSKSTTENIGLYPDSSSGPPLDSLLSNLKAGHAESNLPDMILNSAGRYDVEILPTLRSQASSMGFDKAGYTKMWEDDPSGSTKLTTFGTSKSFMDAWINGLGKTSEQIDLPESSSMTKLIDLKAIVTDEYIADLGTKKLTAKEAEYEAIIAAKLKRISDKTESFVDIGNNYFDLKKLGSDSDSVKVFSISTGEWPPYAKMLQQSINNSKDKETLEKLSYYGKDPKKLPFDVWPEKDFSQLQQFGWMDSGLEFDKATTAQVTRKVTDRAKQANPDIIEDSITGKIKLNDPNLELPYRLNYSQNIKPTWWDTKTNSKSKKPIVDGFDSLYLLNGESKTADAKGSADNILQSLNTGDKRLFATVNGLEKYVPDQLSEQINNDPKALEYLKSAMTSGYDSKETQALERSNLDSVFKLKLSKNILGLLTRADVPGGFGDQFKETGDIFDGDIQFFLRDYIVETAKKLSSDKKTKELADSKIKFGKTRDTSKLVGFNEGQEFAGASLALVLGAEELFGPGGEFELPGILPRNWFKPVLPTQFNSIYDMPQGLIREGMGRLGSWLSDASGRVEQYITPEMAQKDPRQYDKIIRAQTYMRGALSAFSSFEKEATGEVKRFFDPDLFKGPPTPNGNPIAIKQAIDMFQSLETNDKSSSFSINDKNAGSNPYLAAMDKAVLTQDKRNKVSEDLKGSKIDKSSSGKDTIDLQEFNPLDLDNSTYRKIFEYALNPYNQYTNRDIRAGFFDEFITRIPTATRSNGAPLFSVTEGARYGGALKSLKSWFGGKGNDDAMMPVKAGKDWEGIDYLYDQTANKTVSFGDRLTSLNNSLAPNFYDANKYAFDFVGGTGMFGELPDLSDYEKRKVEYKNQGGLIYASEGQLINFQSRGTDTVPAMLTPGEFVVNSQATSQNLPLLNAINKNKGGKIGYYKNGGVVDNESLSLLSMQMKVAEKLSSSPRNISDSSLSDLATPLLKKSNDNEIISIGILQSILKTLGDIKDSTLTCCMGKDIGKPLDITTTLPSQVKPVAPLEIKPPVTMEEGITEGFSPPRPPISVPNKPDFEPIPFPEVEPIVPEMPTIPEMPLPDVKEPVSTPEDIRPRTIPQMPVMPQPEVVLPQKPAYTEPFPVEVFPPRLLPNFPKTPTTPTYEKGPYGFDSPFFDTESLPKPKQRRPLVIGEAARDAGVTTEDAVAGRDRVANDVPELDQMIAEVEARTSYNKAKRAAQSAEAGEGLSSGISRANGAIAAIKGVQEIKEAQTSYDAFRGGLGLVGGIGDIADSSSLPLSITGDAASLTRNSLDFYNNPETRLQSGLGIANDATSLTLRAAQATSLAAPAGSLVSQVAAPLGAVGAVAEIGRGAVAGAYDTSNEAKLRTTVENIIIGAATGDATTGGSGLAGAANAFGANIQQGGNTDVQLSAIESQLRGLTTGAAIGTAFLPGPGTAIGAVAGQGVAATGELYKSGSAYARESAQAQQLQARTDKMVKSSKTQEYVTGADGSVSKQSKNPDSFSFGLDAVEGNLVRNVAGLTKEISTLRLLQEQGHTTFNNQPIEEAIYGKEQSLYAGRSDLKSVAVQRANDENTTLFELGPNSPLVKSKIDKYQALIGRAIEELGDSLSGDIKPESLPSIEKPDLTTVTPKQSAVYASTGALFSPRGTDTIPAMLSPGEFVVNANATSQNLSLLKEMNKGGVIYRADGSVKPEGIGAPRSSRKSNKSWWSDPSVVGADTDTASKLYYEILGTSRGNAPTDVTIYNKNNPGKPKKADGSYWTQDESQRWSDFVNTGKLTDYNTNQKLQEAKELQGIREESRRSREYHEANQKRKPEDRSFLWTEGRSWMQYLGIPSTLSEAETVAYGALSKVIPGALGVLGGGLGFAAGSILGPGAIIPGIAGGVAGNQLGEFINEHIYDILPQNMKDRIESKRKEHPENYEAGRWIGFASELAAGAAYGPVIEQMSRRYIGNITTKYLSTKLGAKYLGHVSEKEAEVALRKAEQMVEEMGKENSGKVLVHGGGSGRILPSGTQATAAETPVNTSINSTYERLGGRDPKAGVAGRSTGAVAMGGFNMGLDSVADNLRYAFEARQGVITAIENGKASVAALDNIGILAGDITADSLRGMGGRFTEVPELLDKGIVQLMQNARQSNPEAFKELAKTLYEKGDTKLLSEIVKHRDGTWADVLNKVRDSFMNVANTPEARSAAERKFQDLVSSAGIHGTKHSAQLIRDPAAGAAHISGESLGLYTTEFFNSFRSRNLSELMEIEKSAKAIWERILEKFTASGAKETARETTLGTGGNMAFDATQEFLFGDKEEETKAMNMGGVVYANRGKYINFQPKGTDTVPAMLTPGEFVINARSTAQHLPLLKAINSGADVSSPNTMSTGGVVYLVGGGRAPSGMTPAGTQAIPLPLTRQQKANRTSAVGTPPRIDPSHLDPDTGEIVWTMVLKDRIYTVLRDGLQKSFKRLAESGTSDSYEDYNNTLIDFKEFQYQLKQNLNKYKAGDYGESVTYLQSLKREYEIAARTGSVGEDQRDWRKKKQPTQQQGQPQQPQQPNQQQGQQQNQAPQDPRAQAEQEQREKNNRIAEAGMAPRINEQGLDPNSGKINWTMVLKDNLYATDRAETEAAFEKMSQNPGPVDFTEYNRMTQFFQDFKSKLKSNVDKYSAGDYGESRTFLDSLNREYNIAAKGGQVGGNKPDWRKPRQKPAGKPAGQQPPNPAQAPGQAPDPNAPLANPYSRTDPLNQNQQQKDQAKTDRAEKNARIAAMGAPPRIAEKNLDPVTGNISWPMVLTDDIFSENRTSIQSLFSDIASKGTPADMDTYQEGLSQFKDLKALMKENVNNYNAGDYGSSRTFVDSLESEFIKAAKSGYIGGETPNWRRRKDDQAQAQPPANETEEQRARREKKEKNDRVSEVGQAPRIDPSFLDPATGQVRWTMALTDPIYSSNRDDVQKAFSDIAAGGFPVEYDQYEKTNTDFQEFKNKFKENVNNYSAGDYGESRTYLDSLHREYDNAAKGGGVGGDKPNWRKPRNLATGGLVYSNNQALSNSNSNYASGGIVYANNGALIDAQASGTDTVPAMLTPGEFVVNRNSAQKFMPVLNAINGGAYSAGGIVNYLANGGLVQPHYLSRGNENPIGAMSQISNSSGVLNNSVGQNMVMAKPAWVDEFIGQAQEVSKAIGNALTDVTSQLNSVGSTMTESAQKLANTSKAISETKFPEEIVLTHSGNIVTDMLPERVNDIVKRSIDTSVAISNNNLNSAIDGVNRGIMKNTDGAIGKTG